MAAAKSLLEEYDAKKSAPVPEAEPSDGGEEADEEDMAFDDFFGAVQDGDKEAARDALKDMIRACIAKENEGKY